MITRSLKLLISAVVYLVTIPSCRRRKAAGQCMILYYHAVTTAQIPSFSRQMNELKRRATVISATAPKLTRPGNRTVAVTFDDGFRSFRDHALPVLTAAGIPSVVFVPSGNLGHPPAWEMKSGLDDAAEVIMRADELRMLPHELVSVGSHSVTHPRLPEIEAPVALWELADSKAALAAITGRSVELFSFPYGRWSPDLVERGRELGYRRMFTSEPVPLRGGEDSFLVGRVAVGPDDWPVEFRLKVLGAYRWVPAASRLKQRLRRRR